MSGSCECNHWVLCGCHGKHNKSMVPTISQTLAKMKLSHWIKTWHVIYVDTCVICNQQHVGETINTFSTRWLAQKATWNKRHKKEHGEQMVSSRHCTAFHSILNKSPTYDFYTVTFVEQPVSTLWIHVKINGFYKNGLLFTCVLTCRNLYFDLYSFQCWVLL